MPLTEKQVALLDILTDRLVSTLSTFKKVRTMTDAEVDSELLKWEELSDMEMSKLEDH